jgi:hypothetical protein
MSTYEPDNSGSNVSHPSVKNLHLYAWLHSIPVQSMHTSIHIDQLISIDLGYAMQLRSDIDNGCYIDKVLVSSEYL